MFLRYTGDGVFVCLLSFRAVVIKAAMYNYWQSLHNMLLHTTAYLMSLYVALYCAMFVLI